MEGRFGDAGASTLCRRFLDGEGMSEVCRDFGISRKTGYKIFNRYRDQGLEALTDRSRRPVRYANRLPDQVERLIVDLKRDKPHWGARKIRELLVRKLAGDVCLLGRDAQGGQEHRACGARPPRPGQPRPNLRTRANGTPLSAGANPNDLWCADFKGEFKLGNGRYCYPLTVSDHAARYLLLCEAFESTRKPRSSPRSSGCSVTAACPSPSAATTGCRSPVPTASTISPASRSGGCGWASPSSASSPAIRSRTAAMSACT